MTKTTGIEKVKQARARLILAQPFFGTAAISLKLKTDNSVPMACTDGKSLIFNENYIDSLELPIVESLICHEVMHNIMLHPLRLKGRDHKRANIAMDYVVNGILKRSGLEIDKRWLYDEKLSARDQSFESVYAALNKPEEKPPEPPPQNGDGEGPEDGPKDPQDGAGDTNEPKDDHTGVPRPGDQNTPKNGPGSPQDDSNESDAGAPGDSGDPGEPESWQIGEVRAPEGEDGKPLNESEEGQLRQDWKVTATKALTASRGCGKIPSGMERLVEEMIIEKRDLEDILRDFIQKSFNGDYTWNRPNKRHLIHDLYLPSIQGEIIPEIVMVMDTSGSVGDAECNYFTAKLNNILNEFNTKVHVVYCDTTCYDGGEYAQDDLPVVLKPIGGGGTDFRPAFRWIEEHDIEPTCVIYYTDGYCSRFPDEPDYPVLWAVYGEARSFPFGDLVNITPE